jgi:shikimate dehydrogenase
MQGAAIAARGVDAVYAALECSDSSFGGLMRGLALAGGGGNVTLPHKTAAVRQLDRPSPEVERTGACNTFWGEGGLVYGDNTDVAGFRGAVSRLLPGGLAGTTVLLLGAGGAARAALCGLIDVGAGEIWVHNRSIDGARRLVDRLGAGRARVLDDVRTLAGGSLDLVIQATPLGLSAADPCPFDLHLERGPRVGALLDLVYSPASTPLVNAALASGIRAADGREMLVLQGAEAFRRWFGDPVPVDEMRRALSGA